MQTIYLIIGTVTNNDAHIGGIIGDKEYQFSDAPSGMRSYSADYIDLEKGLNDHKDCIIIQA